MCLPISGGPAWKIGPVDPTEHCHHLLGGVILNVTIAVKTGINHPFGNVCIPRISGDLGTALWHCLSFAELIVFNRFASSKQAGKVDSTPGRTRNLGGWRPN